MASHTSAIRNLPTVHEIAAQVREGKAKPGGQRAAQSRRYRQIGWRDSCLP